MRVLLGREPINLEWSADVRFGAHNGLKSDIAPCPKSANKRLMRCGIKSLFDQLVRAGEQRIRDRDPQGLGRLQVDDQYRLRRLLHRKIRRLLAFENTACVAAQKPLVFVLIRAETDESARLHSPLNVEEGGQPVTRRDSHQLRGKKLE